MINTSAHNFNSKVLRKILNFILAVSIWTPLDDGRRNIYVKRSFKNLSGLFYFELILTSIAHFLCFFKIIYNFLV